MASFFEEEPEHDVVDPDEDRHEHPQLPVVGATLPIDVVIGRSDTAVLVLRSVRARPTGLELTITAYWRVAEQVHASWGGGGPGEYPPVGHMHEGGGWAAKFPSGFLPEHEVDDNGELLPGFITFGIRFADGSAISNVSYSAWRLRDHTAVPSVGMSGGHSHGRGHGPGSFGMHEALYWTWPLPPLPSMDVICLWPAFDIAETVTTFETGPMHEAAARAKPIWPDWELLDPNRYRGPWHRFD